MKKIFTLLLCLGLASLSARTVQILEVPSEVGAGTRGASLGAKAVEIAAMAQNNDYFKRHSVTVVDTENEALLQSNNYPYAKRIDALKKVLERTTSSVNRLMNEKDRFLVVIAGDHSTAAGTIAGIKQAHPKKRLGVIWIDAHADIHSPLTSPSGNTHGMPVAIALGEDNYLKQKNRLNSETKEQWEEVKSLGGPKRNIQPSDIVYYAVRDTEPQEEFLLRKYSIKNYTVDDIRRRGIRNVVNEGLNRLRHCDLIYISFDVDSMDEEVSRGTGTPVSNGITDLEAEALLLEMVQSPKVCCLEFAEINPLLDQGNKMAEISFRILDSVTKKIEQ